jgi:hypothetical protein
VLGSMQEAVVCVMNWGGGVCLGVHKLEKGIFVLSRSFCKIESRNCDM